MKITNVIYGTWFIQYSVRYSFLIRTSSKIVRIESKSFTCGQMIRITKQNYYIKYHPNFIKRLYLNKFTENPEVYN